MNSYWTLEYVTVVVVVMRTMEKVEKKTKTRKWSNGSHLVSFEEQTLNTRLVWVECWWWWWWWWGYCPVPYSCLCMSPVIHKLINEYQESRNQECNMHWNNCKLQHHNISSSWCCKDTSLYIWVWVCLRYWDNNCWSACSKDGVQVSNSVGFFSFFVPLFLNMLFITKQKMVLKKENKKTNAYTRACACATWTNSYLPSYDANIW